MHPIPEEIFKHKPKSIFDVGCGQGLLFKPYYDQQTRLTPAADTLYDRTRLKIGGIDISEVNIEAIKLNFPDYADNFLLRDVYDIPWPVKNKEYELAFTIGTLIMIPDPFPVIKEMLRIAKKVIVAEFHDPELSAIGRDIGPQPVEAHGPRWYRNYEKVFKQFGLKVKIKRVEDKWVCSTKK